MLSVKNRQNLDEKSKKLTNFGQNFMLTLIRMTASCRCVLNYATAATQFALASKSMRFLKLHLAQTETDWTKTLSFDKGYYKEL